MAPIADPVFMSEPAPASVPTREVDFTRRRVCVLGLPFDPISLSEAVEQVRADAFAGRRCWIATPNLNFAIAARSDAAFRQSVLRSDLNLVDGMPLVWMSRALGALVLVAAAVLVAWRGEGRRLIRLRELFGLPLYIAAKVPVYLRLLGRRQVEWVRTKRDGAGR